MPNKKHKSGGKQSDSTLKMEAKCSRETSTRHYIPEDRALHNHRCEHLEILHNEEQYTVGGICHVQDNFKICIKSEVFVAVII
jgi:hypothetical protein